LRGTKITDRVSTGRLATVTLNVTLDRVMLIPGFVPGSIYGVGDLTIYGSGKGLNVARSAVALGGEARVTGLVAGQCGQWICDLLVTERISESFIRLPGGQSRIATIVVDVENRRTTVINGPGPTVPPGAWPEICSTIDGQVAGFTWLALAGSAPLGVPDSAYADLCRRARSRGQYVCLDARDRWLSQALTARPYLVKCNQDEASAVLRRRIDTPEQARDAAFEWAALNIPHVAITMGVQGAVAVTGQRAWHVQAPKVDALCPVGSGDALMAGLIVALDRGAPWPEAVRYGVAVGAANTLVPGSGYLDLQALPDLLSRTEIHTI
jgi:tagatose 6-phosphate kinase